MRHDTDPAVQYPVWLNDHCLLVNAGEPILSAARRAGLWLPFECGWGSCGTCRATLLQGQVTYLFPDAPARRPRDERHHRILLCQTTPAGPVRIKPLSVRTDPRPDLPTADYSGQLSAVHEIGPDLFRVVIELDRPATFLPGQYAILELSPGLRRCYSMTNLPGVPEVQFLIRREPHGRLSPILTRLPVGTPLRLELPYGAAYLQPPKRPLVFLAGGTGIAPHLSMLRALAAHSRPDSLPVSLFYGARNRASLVELDTILRLLAQVPQSRLFLAIQQPDPEWSGPVGSILDVLVAQLTDWSSYDYYISGPPGLVSAAQQLLADRAVPVTQIHTDPFG